MGRWNGGLHQLPQILEHLFPGPGDLGYARKAEQNHRYHAASRGRHNRKVHVRVWRAKRSGQVQDRGAIPKAARLAPMVVQGESPTHKQSECTTMSIL